jgi:HPt (histidine-containing phosphotransfer) domain-containing protein
MDEMLTKPAHLPQLRELLSRYGAGASLAAPLPLPASPETNADIVDRATVEQFHASLSPQKYGSLLSSFFESHAGTLERLRAMAAAGDRSAVWSQAHALKGAALSLGLRAVVEHAEGVKNAASDHGHGDLHAALNTLERHLQITRDLCQSLGWLSAAAPGRTVS